MNVNPFSYLIEKLKGKVNKSGDTITGRLNIERSGESYVRAVNTDKQVGAYLDSDNNAEHGVWSNGYNNGSFQSLGRWLLKRGTSGDVYVNDTKVPYNGGTVALTSDLISIEAFSISANTYGSKIINNCGVGTLILIRSLQGSSNSIILYINAANDSTAVIKNTSDVTVSVSNYNVTITATNIYAIVGCVYKVPK